MSAASGQPAGVVPMLVCPLQEDGSLAQQELAGLAEHCLLEGAGGIAVNGLGGESASLSIEERMVIAETVVGVACGEPVVVGATAPSTSISRRLAEHAASTGAHTVMLAPAPEVAGSAGALYEHYSQVAAAIAPTALMVQDAPQFVGVSLEAGFVGELRAEHANVRYAKPEGSPAADAVGVLVGDPSLGVFGGQAGLHMLDELAAGAVGIIPGCEYVRGFVDVYDAWRDGDGELANELYARLLPLLVCEFQGLPTFIAAAKTVLVARGLISSPRLRDADFTLRHRTREAVLAHAHRAGALSSTKSTKEPR